MWIKRFDDCEEIVALDGTILRELLNPRHDKEDLKLDYSIAHAIVKPGKSSMPHRFFEASEVYYIIQGTGIMHIDEETAKVAPGDVVYIHPKGIQYIENTGTSDLVFLCMVYPPWFAESEELVE
ncbi:MAG: cupin domain-containing protein [Candidatus Thorarchaeota archaeon]|jgi:mannose-6-phosphate isomerase-like protein (cupin superfamily)